MAMEPCVQELALGQRGGSRTFDLATECIDVWESFSGQAGFTVTPVSREPLV
jgi:hypothetical protein